MDTYEIWLKCVEQENLFLCMQISLESAYFNFKNINNSLFLIQLQRLANQSYLSNNES